MNDRYEILERLQRLRESGAVSEAEFEAEKARLLGHASEAPAADEPVPEAPPETHSRLPLFFLIGAGVLIVAILLGLLLGRIVSGPEASESSEEVAPAENYAADINVVQPVPPQDVRTLAPQEQLSRAFQAAFGAQGAATLRFERGQDAGTESVSYKPGRLIWPSFGPVLLSEGQVSDGGHASAGRIAIHYLKAVGDRFEMVKAWPGRVVTGSSGRVARWSVSARFGEWPVIVSEGGGTSQGYSCSSAKLTELRPDGPVELANVPLSYGDARAQAGDSKTSGIEGRIINVMPGQAFDVVYKGARAFSDHWVRTAAGYQVAGGKSQAETCG